jgi:hypothetical protein
LRFRISLLLYCAVRVLFSELDDELSYSHHSSNTSSGSPIPSTPATTALESGHGDSGKRLGEGGTLITEDILSPFTPSSADQQGSATETKEKHPKKVDNKEKHKNHCPLCLDIIRKPAAIPCGHIGCWQCLMSYALKPSASFSSSSDSSSSSSSLIKCPVCRYEFLPQRLRPIHL